MTEKNKKPFQFWKFGGEFRLAFGVFLSNEQIAEIKRATDEKLKEGQTNEQFEDEINWLAMRFIESNHIRLRQLEDSESSTISSSAALTIFPPRGKG
jgi:hypothetical protein